MTIQLFGAEATHQAAEEHSNLLYQIRSKLFQIRETRILRHEETEKEIKEKQVKPTLSLYQNEAEFTQRHFVIM